MTLFIVFNKLYNTSTTIDYMHQLCILYMLNYPVIHSLSERASGSKHARNCVYPNSKIENNSYHRELVGKQSKPSLVMELKRWLKCRAATTVGKKQGLVKQ